MIRVPVRSTKTLMDDKKTVKTFSSAKKTMLFVLDKFETLYPDLVSFRVGIRKRSFSGAGSETKIGPDRIHKTGCREGPADLY